MKTNFKGCMNTLFNMLKNIRLATIIEKNKKGKVKATYQLEEIDEEENELVECLNIKNMHLKKIKFKGFSIYN